MDGVPDLGAFIDESGRVDTKIEDVGTTLSDSGKIEDIATFSKEQLGSLTNYIDHWLKITRSYWSDLFNCYQVEGWPKTNNDLEPVFGSFRHHSRRTTGRKKSPISLESESQKRNL